MRHFGRLLLRLTIGGFFIGHGTQKLFGWFGGPGLSGTAAFFEQLGMRPGRRHALAAGVAETAGGAAVAAGLATPLAASALIAVMLTAIKRVHWPKGPWAANGGYEYNAVLIAALLALVEAGPGDLSIDGSRGRRMSGPGWMLLALTLGAAGAVGAHVAAQSTPAPLEAQAATTGAAATSDQAGPVSAPTATA